jgi:hypothetical protein
MGVIPGKLFEYLAAKRPILCIGPVKGDSCRIIKETSAGYVFGFDEKEKLKRTLLELYSAFKKSGFVDVSNQGIEKFSRKNLTGEMAELLNKIAN